jgi:hypothetical protein
MFFANKFHNYRLECKYNTYFLYNKIFIIDFYNTKYQNFKKNKTYKFLAIKIYTPKIA